MQTVTPALLVLLVLEGFLNLYCFKHGFGGLALDLIFTIFEFATVILLLTSLFATDKDGRLIRGTLGYKIITWLDPMVEIEGAVYICAIFWKLVFCLAVLGGLLVTATNFILFVGGIGWGLFFGKVLSLIIFLIWITVVFGTLITLGIKINDLLVGFLKTAHNAGDSPGPFIFSILGLFFSTFWLGIGLNILARNHEGGTLILLALRFIYVIGIGLVALQTSLALPFGIYGFITHKDMPKSFLGQMAGAVKNKICPVMRLTLKE